MSLCGIFLACYPKKPVLAVTGTAFPSFHKHIGGEAALQSAKAYEEEEIHYLHTASKGLIDNGQYKSTNRLLVLVPHEGPPGIMRVLENLCTNRPRHR